MVGVGSGFMVGETMQEPISQFLHHYLAQAITTEAYLRSQVYVLPIYRETALVFDQTKAHVCLLFQLRQRFVITLECMYLSRFYRNLKFNYTSGSISSDRNWTGFRNQTDYSYGRSLPFSFFVPENSFIETKYKRKSHGNQLKQSLGKNISVSVSISNV